MTDSAFGQQKLRKIARIQFARKMTVPHEFARKRAEVAGAPSKSWIRKE